MLPRDFDNILPGLQDLLERPHDMISYLLPEQIIMFFEPYVLHFLEERDIKYDPMFMRNLITVVIFCIILFFMICNSKLSYIIVAAILSLTRSYATMLTVVSVLFSLVRSTPSSRNILSGSHIAFAFISSLASLFLSTTGVLSRQHSALMIFSSLAYVVLASVPHVSHHSAGPHVIFSLSVLAIIATSAAGLYAYNVSDFDLTASYYCSPFDSRYVEKEAYDMCLQGIALWRVQTSDVFLATKESIQDAVNRKMYQHVPSFKATAQAVYVSTSDNSWLLLKEIICGLAFIFMGAYAYGWGFSTLVATKNAYARRKMRVARTVKSDKMVDTMSDIAEPPYQFLANIIMWPTAPVQYIIIGSISAFCISSAFMYGKFYHLWFFVALVAGRFAVDCVASVAAGMFFDESSVLNQPTDVIRELLNHKGNNFQKGLILAFSCLPICYVGVLLAIGLSYIDVCVCLMCCVSFFGTMFLVSRGASQVKGIPGGGLASKYDVCAALCFAGCCLMVQLNVCAFVLYVFAFILLFVPGTSRLFCFAYESPKLSEIGGAGD